MINEVLFKLGCKPSLKGFLPLHYCITYALKHNDIPITNLYFECAEIYGGNWHSVERCIRHCIHQAYNMRNITIWDKVFYDQPQRPTAKEFIAFVTYYIKSREEQKNALESNRN